MDGHRRNILALVACGRFAAAGVGYAVARTLSERSREVRSW